jgi:hypothetical protein
VTVILATPCYGVEDGSNFTMLKLWRLGEIHVTTNGLSFGEFVIYEGDFIVDDVGVSFYHILMAKLWTFYMTVFSGLNLHVSVIGSLHIPH